LPNSVLYPQLNVLRAITIRGKWLSPTPVRPILNASYSINTKIKPYQYPVQ